MKHLPTSHKDILVQLGPPNVTNYIKARGRKLTIDAVHNWSKRGRIPMKYWRAIEALAVEVGASEIDFGLLERLSPDIVLVSSQDRQDSAFEFRASRRPLPAA
jgi:hypothetical protein